MTNNEYYIIAKDLLTAILTITGLIIAATGLVTWKKQIKGGKEFETAYNLHLSILRLRDAIKHVRNPAIWPSESQRALKLFKEKYPERNEFEIQKNVDPFIYELRWEKITHSLTETESHLLSAEALWGSEILQLIKPLRKKVTELNLALKQFFQPELRTKDYNKIDTIIYNSSNDDKEDTFSLEVSSIIEPIKNYLEQKIK